MTLCHVKTCNHHTEGSDFLRETSRWWTSRFGRHHDPLFPLVCNVHQPHFFAAILALFVVKHDHGVSSCTLSLAQRSLTSKTHRCQSERAPSLSFVSPVHHSSSVIDPRLVIVVEHALYLLTTSKVTCITTSKCRASAGFHTQTNHLNHPNVSSPFVQHHSL